MRLHAMVICAGTLCLGAATADWVISPVPADLGDLSHETAYSWNIMIPDAVVNEILAGQLTGVEIEIGDLYNQGKWAGAENILFIDLLEDPVSFGNAPAVVNTTFDAWFGVGDYFAEHGYSPVALAQYSDVDDGANPVDWTYTFSAGQLGSFVNAASDGQLALGFDPDCHFYNSGVKLTVRGVAEPGLLSMFGMVLVALTGIAASRRRK